MKPCDSSDCPIARAAAIVGDVWTILVLRELADGQRRFKDLSEAIDGISSRTLTLRLRKLEDEMMIVKTVFKEAPPRVEYSLSDKGRAALPVLETMKIFGARLAQ